MTAREEILHLADKCEGLEQPNAMIDAEIEVARHRPAYPDARIYMLGRNPAAGVGPEGGWRKAILLFQDVRYTRSIDAALTLVPDRHAVDLTIWAGRHRARVLPLREIGGRWLHSGSDPHFCADGAMPAIAICAAALRAWAGPQP